VPGWASDDRGAQPGPAQQPSTAHGCVQSGAPGQPMSIGAGVRPWSGMARMAEAGVGAATIRASSPRSPMTSRCRKAPPIHEEEVWPVPPARQVPGAGLTGL
jgi:hypothetical protein